MSVRENIQNGKYKVVELAVAKFIKHQISKRHMEEMAAQFRNDLEEEFGMKGHPKADELWDLAFDYDGCWFDHMHDILQEILEHYENMRELVV